MNKIRLTTKSQPEMMMVRAAITSKMLDLGSNCNPITGDNLKNYPTDEKKKKLILLPGCHDVRACHR